MIARGIKSGEDYELPDFGVFKTRRIVGHRAFHIGKKVMHELPPYKIVKFKPNKDLKKYVNNV